MADLSTDWGAARRRWAAGARVSGGRRRYERRRYERRRCPGAARQQPAGRARPRPAPPAPAGRGRCPGPARHAANQRAPRHEARPLPSPRSARPQEPPGPRNRPGPGAAQAARPEGRGWPRRLRGGCSGQVGRGVVRSGPPRLGGGLAPRSSVTGRQRLAEGCAASAVAAWLKLSVNSAGPEVLEPGASASPAVRARAWERRSRSGFVRLRLAPCVGALPRMQRSYHRHVKHWNVQSLHQRQDNDIISDSSCVKSLLSQKLCDALKREDVRRKQTMKVLVIGLGGVTNGGKTTLAEKLKNMLPNCDVISQDDFFKPESEVETDERGFKLYDGMFNFVFI
nr:nicotinamide riboside kinase 1 isoform X5 [Taeniopygia guttata]